jgi:hypothetical protein
MYLIKVIQVLLKEDYLENRVKEMRVLSQIKKVKNQIH